VLFLDEIDTIVTSRKCGSHGGDVEARVLATLLVEMDGVLAADGVLVVGATNRPDSLGASSFPTPLHSTLFVTHL
jgi:SpoVK/Ycf46/Vps4 family AAA+-type ATPase